MRGLTCQNFDEDVLMKDLNRPLDDCMHLELEQLETSQASVERFNESSRRSSMKASQAKVQIFGSDLILPQKSFTIIPVHVSQSTEPQHRSNLTRSATNLSIYLLSPDWCERVKGCSVFSNVARSSSSWKSTEQGLFDCLLIRNLSKIAAQARSTTMP